MWYYKKTGDNMDNIYFCYSVPSLGETDYDIDGNEDENKLWVKTQEQKMMLQAKKQDKLIEYDRSTNKFYKNLEEINIKGLNIFPRSPIDESKNLIETIINNGGNCLETLNDYEKITNWPLYVGTINRKTVLTTYQEFQDNYLKYKDIFKKVFLKTTRKSNIHHSLKSFGKIKTMFLVTDNLLSGNDFSTNKSKQAADGIFMTNPPLFNLSSDENIILSETFEKISDEHNDCLEYRVFVINNELYSISRSYVDYDTELSKDIFYFAIDQINIIKEQNNFPANYVMDITKARINGKEVIDIIEFNPICCSGLEVSHNLVKQGKVLKKTM